MNQNNGMQKRMLIMTLVVFVFFIAYEFLVLKPQQEAKAALVKQEQVQKQNAAPDVNASTQMVSTDVNGNPIDMSKSLDALSAKAIASSQIVSVIKTAKNIIEIDTLGRIAQVTLLEEKYKDENASQIKLFEANQLRPLEVRFADINFAPTIFSFLSKSPSSIVFKVLSFNFAIKP